MKQKGREEKSLAEDQGAKMYIAQEGKKGRG